jgi:hypothetical protein
MGSAWQSPLTDDSARSGNPRGDEAVVGKPPGLKIRMIDQKGDNLFVAEFNFKQDMDRALGGFSWLVGKHTIILHEYNESLKPSEIRIDHMEICARITDLPLGWMNKHRGERAMVLIGNVKKMDVDKESKASDPYLHGCVAIEVTMPIRRGVLLKAKKDAVAEWFYVEYEKLPFFYSSCGIMGHSHLECDKPLVRNAEGKLSYEAKLRVYDPKKKGVQSFSKAATETCMSASSGNKKHSPGGNKSIR